jgi:tetratricopeptide (TPR) repeat protein
MLPVQPSDIDHGWQLLASGRAHEAIAFAEQALARGGGGLPALHLIAEAALQSGHVAKAVHASSALVQHAGTLHWAWGLLARATLASGRPGEAAHAAVRSATLLGATAATLANAGTILSAADRHDEALPLFRRAVALAPDDPRYRFNLAMEQRFVGDFAGAEASCDQVIAADPGHAEAWLIRSGLRQQTAGNNHVAAIEARLAHGVADWRREGQLLYALAKELEDLGEHARSFAALARGARLRRSHTDYDVERDLAMIDALIAGFPAGERDAPAAPENLSPAIFIVGLPRTGTTLAERVLSSHSQVESLGEPTAFPAAMAAGMQGRARPGQGPADRVATARAIPPAELAQGYMDRLEGLRGTAPRFIDKLPINFLNVGLIARALPAARIIHLRRDPMDAGYAMLKTWFADAYPFSYDQADLGRYIAAYRRLMAHWQAAFPGLILDVDYEALVDDVPGQARRMLEHCGLDWEAACAAPHRNPTPSTTASASQVRQPAHRRSVGKWTCYRSELEPLRAELARAGLA